MSAPTPVARGVVSVVAGSTAAALLAWGAWYGYAELISQPIARVVFAGAPDRLDPADLVKLEQGLLATPSASIEAIRVAARQVPWVREATVRRRFPDAVEITFTVHEAFARWNDGQLVGAAGEVFTAAGAGALPQLRGPEGSAALVVHGYQAAIAALGPIGSAVKELRLSPRGAWHATLDSGLGIALGRGDWRARAERFAAAWPKLAPEARAADYADLRYPNGFALKRVASPTLPPAR